MSHQTFVIPAKAGTQGLWAQRLPLWIPAFAGMTNEGMGMMCGGAAQ